MKKLWDERYAKPEYVYGVKPNQFFKEKIDHLNPGKILLPADGEGRNGVYAASLGWEVHAFDFSSKAREKAMLLCQENDVSIKYYVHSMEEAEYDLNSFDVLGFIYAHNPNREYNHKHLLKFLKPGGLVILEAFSKSQLGNSTGGPKNIDLLYSIDELKKDFSHLNDLQIWEESISLDEGAFHKGKASIIRLIGSK